MFTEPQNMEEIQLDLSHYIDKIELSQQNELSKVKSIAYYENISKNQTTFLLSDVTDILSSIGHPISNMSRMKRYLSKSKDFRKISDGVYMLTPPARAHLTSQYGSFFQNEDYIESNSEILDEALFCKKRGYLDKLIQQINNCYNNQCYDACAVCMRRVFEITLIHAYENLGIQNEIKKDGEYVMLERIVANAVCNPVLAISRLKKEYDSIREIGNYAAHRVFYNTRKKDIDDIKQLYRVCLEELYYKAGFLK